MDSVYVIAYYTDAILADGGPEGFNGLPGMILGVVMPRLNMTYFATKFENYVADEKILAPSTKGQKITEEKLIEKLRESMSNWGDFMQRMIWYVSI
jgi:GLPGLI family protein